ncbi:hypothetical protein KKHLCK_16250 [Candidatus Electrothrix laxa]
MKLEDFIRDSLVSIGQGIAQANQYYEKPPPFKLLGGSDGTIDFEINVTVENIESGKKGAKASGKVLTFLSVSTYGDSNSRQKDSNKHLIKFKVKADERFFYITSNEEKDER